MLGRIASPAARLRCPASTGLDARDQPLATTRPENGYENGGDLGPANSPVKVVGQQQQDDPGVMHRCRGPLARGAEAIDCASMWQLRW